jgi:hypothetical protein
MAKGTSFDEVGEAVEAVKVMQEQIAGLLEAIKRLTLRIEAIEKKSAAEGTDA